MDQKRPTRATTLSAAVLALIAAGASGTAIVKQYLSEKEGISLRAYQDGARVWTICYGKTAGVRAGDVMTRAQCNAWLDSEVGRRIAAVHAMVRVPQSEPAIAGITSFCFNVGIPACRSSTALREINAGRQQAGCEAMLRFRYITRDGIKVDCFTDTSGTCAGLKDRRYGEVELCAL